jgi:hypothetical protein
MVKSFNMKYAIIVVLLVVSFTQMFLLQRSNKTIHEMKIESKRVESEYLMNFRMELYETKKRAVDSMLIVIDNLPPRIEYVEKIKIKHEKVTDSILSKPVARQLDFLTRELNRLYPN